MLAAEGFGVDFADRDPLALDSVAETLARTGYRGNCWQVDFELADTNPLAGKSYAAILVFNYLHRPLMPAINEATNTGGLIFYETFTEAQAQRGRPKNPAYLLRPGELKTYFAGWEVLHYFEGEKLDPARSVASLIARRNG